MGTRGYRDTEIRCHAFYTSESSNLSQMVSLLNCSREAQVSNLGRNMAVRCTGVSVPSIRTDELEPHLGQVLFLTDPYHLVTHQTSHLSTLHTWGSGCVRKQTAYKEFLISILQDRSRHVPAWTPRTNSPSYRLRGGQAVQ